MLDQKGSIALDQAKLMVQDPDLFLVLDPAWSVVLDQERSMVPGLPWPNILDLARSRDL